MRKWIIIWIALAGFLTVACSQTSDEQMLIPPEGEDLVSPSGAFDTGYYSDQAMEIQGVYNGTVMLDLSDLPEDQRRAFADSLSSDQNRIRDLVTKQIKFGKKQLNTEKLHMNLSIRNLTSAEVGLQDGQVWIAYSLNMETILSLVELREAGIEPESFTDREFQVSLPQDPREVFARVGQACAEGYDEGDLAEHNYFYYFSPDKPGCDLPLTRAIFSLSSLLPRKTTYPEYDKLTADGKVTVAMFFGAADYDEEVKYWDWGRTNYRETIRALENRGFRFVEDLEPKGKRYTRTRANLEEIVDLISPVDLAELKNDRLGLFKSAMLSHEVIVYNGHSFYGSLSVLKDSSAYPADTYQIFFMYSCWSYEYYTKQIFKNKETLGDQNGWDLADVVNNTASGWFSDMHGQSRILLTNLFKGCETGGVEGTRHYNWDGIIKAMNKEAHEHARSIGKDSWALFGVSGVRTNRYNPDGGGGGEGEARTYDSRDELEIPDNDPDGIASTIQVDDDRIIRSLKVAVDVTHSWVGDLKLELEHHGQVVTLQAHQGDSADDLVREYSVDSFAGQSGRGAWTLLVSDHANLDSGRLNRWSITLSF